MPVSAQRMELDTVRQQTDNYHRTCRASRPYVLLALLTGALFLLPLLPVWAAEDRVLEQSGIRYPEGYDVNTVGELHGKAYNVMVPESGPVRFSLISRRDTYLVFASPGWYWHDFGASIKDGDEVRVIGSKSLGKDGNLYIIAQEIRLPGSGKPLVFRGKEGAPLWKAMSSGTTGGHSGFGSPLGGKGGAGIGGGGAGRSRR